MLCTSPFRSSPPQLPNPRLISPRLPFLPLGQNHAIAILAIVFAACSLLAGAGLAAAESDSEAPRIAYRQMGPGTADPSAEPGPSLKIWADGHLEATFPSYDRRHGVFLGQLSTQELDDLMAQLENLGLTRFDEPRVENDRLRSALRNGELFEAIGAGWSIFELRRPMAGQAIDQRDGEAEVDVVRLAWKGLGFDARAYPDVEALVDLAKAEEILLGWMTDSRLIRVVEPEGLRPPRAWQTESPGPGDTP